MLDGARSADLADALTDGLLADGRPVLPVSAEHFWRPAGERFEYGREDPDSLRLHWLDEGALRREVFGGSHTETASYLPALYDPVLDRSARQQRIAVPAEAVLLVHGSFLLGRDLPADFTVHLPLSSGALIRRGVPAWQLPAYSDYDRDVRPGEQCDVLVRAEDPARPAVLVRRRPVPG